MKKLKLIIASLVLILVLAGCGTESKSEGDNGTSIDTGIDLYGTYDENDLMIVGIEEEIAGIIVEIPQIDGLKDTEIQEKINQDINERVHKVRDEISNLNHVEYYTNANFSNVISVSVYYGSDETYGQIYLNYNLVDGERLSFEELFDGDTDTLEIIRKGFHETLILSQMTGDISENEFYKVVKSFNESEEKQFSFTPSKIYMYQNDHTASVKMLDIADEISIYSKYLTDESLYEKENIGKKDIMTCVTIPDNVFDHIDFGYLHENCWYDISVMKEYIGDSFPHENFAQYVLFKKDRYDEFYAMIEQYGKEAVEHPENFYIVLSKPSFYMEADSEWNGEEWIEDYKETVIVNEHFTVFEMPKETYDNIYKEKLLEAYRYEYLAMAGGIYLDVTESEVKVLDRYNQKTYNYMTGEELD